MSPEDYVCQMALESATAPAIAVAFAAVSELESVFIQYQCQQQCNISMSMSMSMSISMGRSLVPVRDVIDNQRAGGPTVVAASDRSVPLLSHNTLRHAAVC